MTQYFDPNPTTPSDRKMIPYRMNARLQIIFDLRAGGSYFFSKQSQKIRTAGLAEGFQNSGGLQKIPDNY